MSSLNSRGGWRYNEDSNAAFAFEHKRSTANFQNQPNSNIMAPEVFVHVESHELVNPALKVDQRIYEDMTSNFDAESKRSIVM
ncbi:hypothetical protein AGABI2DRAFT_119608 [Agaricus bisporus var. bisporus H97]|uniref:hypothetical protein n=1 Tax=Agaricus bisporus var. bisporus (strain H97 / ATCC MYA-4626 / FGSC 10389) TaxID=936046 RepID=UPI00029F70C4|nr:hypothetical protein AGABI2DRAFT_119608 [Agaricus bisporus var. bisporus H97]EKV45946.1 hypothetical protein AGABI2DRAFT_119608 [Agaricus bisporus var. bisporus H97]